MQPGSPTYLVPLACSPGRCHLLRGEGYYVDIPAPTSEENCLSNDLFAILLRALCVLDGERLSVANWRYPLGKQITDLRVKNDVIKGHFTTWKHFLTVEEMPVLMHHFNDLDLHKKTLFPGRSDSSTPTERGDDQWEFFENVEEQNPFSI